MTTLSSESGDCVNAKIQHGQFFTVGNPFLHSAFQEWMTGVLTVDGMSLDTPVIEPFAGANNIVRLMRDAGFSFSEWGCFDIDPPDFERNTVSEFPVVARDVLASYPSGYRIAVTNPPYLAKNSAKRRGLDVSFGEMQDLYQVSLDKMLEHHEYIAAIIPESFITARAASRMRRRCRIFISLTSDMFDDTEHPVCLALFSPGEDEQIQCYSGADYMGSLDTMRSVSEAVLAEPRRAKIREKFSITFNDPTGKLGFRGVDDTKENSIRFVDGAEILPENVKPTSRSLTRIAVKEKCDVPSTGLFNGADDWNVGDVVDYQRLIEDANRIIAEYREVSGDVLMTSFKGLRSDGRYRRRLEFSTARDIIEKALAQQF